MRIMRARAVAWRLVATGVLVSAACGTSPHVSFHTLSVAAGPHQRPSPAIKSVQVAAVHLPRSLDRRELVTQTGAHDVDISDRDRWSAPLAEMVRRTLSQDLQSRLPDGAVVMPDMPTTPDTAQIVVSLLQFEPTTSGTAVLVGSWSVSEGNDSGKVLARHDVSFDRPLVGSDADAAASAMSELVGQLATDIVKNLPVAH